MKYMDVNISDMNEGPYFRFIWRNCLSINTISWGADAIFQSISEEMDCFDDEIGLSLKIFCLEKTKKDMVNSTVSRKSK